MLDQVRSDTLIDCERDVLASLLTDNTLIPKAKITLRAHDFAQAQHSLIFKGILAVYSAKSEVDYILLRAWLISQGCSDWLNVTLSLVKDSGLPSSHCFESKLQMIKEASRQRAIKNQLTKLNNTDLSKDDFKQELASSLRKTHELLKTDEDKASCLDTFELMKVIAQNSLQKPDYVPTGFPKFDFVLNGGLSESDLCVIGARPGIGKTTLGLNFAVNAALKGKKSIFFSTEMKAKYIGLRLLSILSRQNCFQYQYESQKLKHFAAEACKHIFDMIFVIDKTRITPDEIKHTVLDITKAKAIDLVVVDYMQRLEPDKVMRTQFENISQIANNLKNVQLELQIPVIALAQLNREVRQKDSGDMVRPQVNHLKESGKIEEAADIIALLHPIEELDDSVERIEFILAKMRNGRKFGKNEMVMRYYKPQFRFEEERIEDLTSNRNTCNNTRYGIR